MTIKKPLAINQPEVGRIIHDLRLLAGLTQEQLATSLGVTHSTINRWENGRSKPSPMAISAIAFHYGGVVVIVVLARYGFFG
jgi:transcriptional regulator with XRE-family HTH domain